MEFYIGIDPGSKGYMCVMDGDRNLSFYPLEEMPVVRSVLRDLAFHKCVCCKEKVASMPGQGVKSVWTFAELNGRILEALEENGIPYQEVTPAKWKGEFGINLGRGATKTEKKDKSIETAKKLFPNVMFRRTEKCRVDDDNMAEAALMAMYASRRL